MTFETLTPANPSAKKLGLRGNRLCPPGVTKIASGSWDAVSQLRRPAYATAVNLSMLQTPLDLAECITRVIACDQEAARQLIQFAYPLVAKIVRSYVPDHNQQEEWEQEVFLRMFGRLAQYRATAPFEHWLAKISVNVCRDALRARRRRPELRWADLTQAEAELLRLSRDHRSETDAGQAMVARELAEKMLGTLAADDRLIIQMLDMEERTVAEVAEVTGRSQTAVKVRAFRARRKLRTVWQGLIDGDAPKARPSADAS